MALLNGPASAQFDTSGEMEAAGATTEDSDGGGPSGGGPSDLENWIIIFAIVSMSVCFGLPLLKFLGVFGKGTRVEDTTNVGP